MKHKRRPCTFPNAEQVLQRYIYKNKTIWVTDSKWGKRKVIPKEIINDLISGKKLSCYILLVEKLGDTGNRMDIIPLESIQNIHE
jgi:hypothetical protein